MQTPTATSTTRCEDNTLPASLKQAIADKSPDEIKSKPAISIYYTNHPTIMDQAVILVGEFIV